MGSIWPGTHCPTFSFVIRYSLKFFISRNDQNWGAACYDNITQTNICVYRRNIIFQTFINATILRDSYVASNSDICCCCFFIIPNTFIS